MKRIQALILGDWRNISRDPMLLFIIAAPVLMGVVLGIIVPFAGELLADRFSVDLHPHYPFIAAVFSLIPAMLAGMMLGLVFLDERDEDILTALSVTPLSRGGYLLYKTVCTAAAGILFFFVFLAVFNLSSYPWLLLLPSAAASGLLGAVLLLMLALFAANKIEGLAMAKVSGIVFMAPVAGRFIPGPWRYIAAVFPPFWPVESFMYALRIADPAACGGATTAAGETLFAAVPLAGLVFWGIGGIFFQGVIIFLLGRLYLNASMLPIRRPVKQAG